MRFDRTPFRREYVEKRTSRLQHAMDFRIGQFLVGYMLEDLGREHEVERVVRPWNLGHGRIFRPVTGGRVEAETLGIAGRTQLDIVLDVITEHMTKSGIEEFVSMPARAAAVVENDAGWRQRAAARLEDSAIEFDDLLGGGIFEHRFRRAHWSGRGATGAVPSAPVWSKWWHAASGRKLYDGAWLAGSGCGRMRLAHEKTVRAR